MGRPRITPFLRLARVQLGRTGERAEKQKRPTVEIGEGGLAAGLRGLRAHGGAWLDGRRGGVRASTAGDSPRAVCAAAKRSPRLRSRKVSRARVDSRLFRGAATSPSADAVAPPMIREVRGFVVAAWAAARRTPRAVIRTD